MGPGATAKTHLITTELNKKKPRAACVIPSTLAARGASGFMEFRQLRGVLRVAREFAPPPPPG